MVSHSDKTRTLDWRKLIVLVALVAMLALVSVASPAQAASLNLDIERVAGQPMTVSTGNDGVYLKYSVKASGDTSVFCAQRDGSNPALCTSNPGRTSSDDAHTVVYAVELEWTKPLGAITGLPVRTMGGLNGFTATTKPANIGDNWRWDNRIEGPISATETRPLLATMRLISVGTEYNVGSNNTLKFAVNPQISVENDEATEGDDANLVFTVTLLPPALETTTVDYGTRSATATGGGVDFADTNGTLTWSVGQSIKYITVPVIDDTVDDSGEELLVIVNNPSGVTRLVDGHGNFQDGLGAIGTIYNDEPGPTDSVANLPLVTIKAGDRFETEGSSAGFTLSRTGETTDALTVSFTVTEDGEMLAETTPTSASFDAGSPTATIEVGTIGDETDEPDSKVTVTLKTGEGYKLGTNDQSKATTTFLDDDAASLPGGTVAVAGTTIWAADMTVTDYGNGSIGAGTASLLANQRGTAGLQAKWLYYHTGERKLRMAFTTNIESNDLLLKTQGVDLPFPEGSSGNSSVTWDDIDVSWTDDQTFEASLVQGEVKAKPAPDPSLNSLAVSNATLSPAFDAETVLYTATVNPTADSITLSGTPNDAQATISFQPSQDADSTQDNHQVAIPVGQSLVSITATTPGADAQRTYRILLTRPPTVAVSFGSKSYTATEDGAPALVTIQLSADPEHDVTVPMTTSPAGGASTDDYTVPENVSFTAGGPLSRTITVTAIADEETENGESLSLSFGALPDGIIAGATSTATVNLTDDPDQAVNNPPTGAPTIAGSAQVGEMLTASTSDIQDADGTDNVTFAYQWVANTGTSDSDIDDTGRSTYTPGVNDVGKTIKVKVSFTDDRGNAETLTSIATAAVLATVPTAPQGLTVTQGNQIQELDASWQAPSSNGGSAVTGYKVQWKEAADNWDTTADVSQAAVTGTTHTITGLTGGVEYAVRVMATNDEGDSPASTVAKSTPAAENNAPTGLPTITGTAQVGEILTASTSNIDDEDGLDNVSYSYQWVRNDGTDDTDIAGETGSTYTLVEADQGQTIKVKVAFTDDADNDESLTSAATVAVLARPNRAATGAPTISGTPQVEQTLTANTSSLSDQDGLSNVSYAYQWLAAGTAISGATGSTYTLTANEQGDTIQVRVDFTDDAGNSESLTSVATDAVAAKPVPLTATFSNVPDSHSGSGEFTFDLSFSENFPLSYRTLRDHAFTEDDNGPVTKAKRKVQGSNQTWTITVEPSGNGAITITLPATTDCTATSAICTDDGRKLSNSNSVSVSGPQ